MREIKFRIFNKTKNKYIYSEEFEGNQTLNLYFFFNFIEDMKCSSDYEFLLLEQFTGLKDNNGKDVYEGDILNLYEYTTRGHKIIKINGFVFFCNKTGEYRIHETKGYKDSYSLFHNLLNNYSGEVIGNINENGNLL